MIALDAVVHEPEVWSIAGLAKALAQLRQQKSLPQIWQSLAHAKGDMNRLPAREGLPPSLGIAVPSGRLSVRSLSRATLTAPHPMVMEAELGSLSHNENIPHSIEISTLFDVYTTP